MIEIIECEELPLEGPDNISDSEKLEFLYQTALKADALMKEIGPQIGPILEGVSKNPMLKMFLR
jgi:hypothetical protein